MVNVLAPACLRPLPRGALTRPDSEEALSAPPHATDGWRRQTMLSFLPTSGRPSMAGSGEDSRAEDPGPSR